VPTAPLSEVVEVTLAVAGLLDRLGVTWLVGGALASSLHGIPRSTQDVDFVADLCLEHVEALSASAGTAFHADWAMIEEAVRRRRSFNLLHLATSFKVDVFVPAHDAPHRSEMGRRQRIVVREAPRAELWVASPEDVVPQELHRYRLGEEVSERQWLDALGVLQVRTRFDRAHVDRWAEATGLAELWTRLQGAAGAGGR
jgi:hypothetical protein